MFKSTVVNRRLLFFNLWLWGLEGQLFLFDELNGTKKKPHLFPNITVMRLQKLNLYCQTGRIINTMGLGSQNIMAVLNLLWVFIGYAYLHMVLQCNVGQTFYLELFTAWLLQARVAWVVTNERKLWGYFLHHSTGLVSTGLDTIASSHSQGKTKPGNCWCIKCAAKEACEWHLHRVESWGKGGSVMIYSRAIKFILYTSSRDKKSMLVERSGPSNTQGTELKSTTVFKLR